MSNLGVSLEADQLVLTKNRDFKESFQNFDTLDQPLDFPPGQIYYELHTGGQQNNLQRVTVDAATSGTYTLSFNGHTSNPFDFGDISDNPQGIPGDLQDDMDSLFGAGNSLVHKPSQLYPVWVFRMTMHTGKELTEQVVNDINTAMNNLFNTFSEIVGITVAFQIQDNLNITCKATANNSFDESGLITFAVSITSGLIEAAFNAIAGLVGFLVTSHIDFYWKHVYQVELIGDLALSPQPALTSNVANLHGSNNDASVTIDVLQPGKTEYTQWYFDIVDSVATLKVESDEVNKIQPRTTFQLVYLPEGEPAGGDPIALGYVRVQDY